MTLLDWLLPWESALPAQAASCIAALLYFHGSRIRPEIQSISGQRRLLFWLGLASVYFAAQSRLDYYSEHSFFIRQIQDGFLHHAGPFLIMLSRPGTTLRAALPQPWVDSIKKFYSIEPIRCLTKFFNHPFVAVTLFCVITAVWLLPSIQFAAMLDWRWNQAMNWSMVLNGLMFWGLVLNAYSVKLSHLSPGCRIAMMLAVLPPQVILGALLFFVSHPLYPVYGLCGLIFSQLSQLADQQIGGLILWMHAAMMSVLGILIVIQREWLNYRPALTPHNCA